LVAIRPDQTILVLEAENRRIQAFSRGGHPVPAFPGIEQLYCIPLVSHGPADTNVVYLSMSVDVANYVYILSQRGNGYDAADLNLDVYTPAGEHLFSQQGLVAAGLPWTCGATCTRSTFNRSLAPAAVRSHQSASTPIDPESRVAILERRRGGGPAATRNVANLDISWL